MAKEKDANKTAEQPQVDPKAMVDELVAKAKAALDEYMKLDQEQIDKITKAMALAGLSAQMELAKMAVEETGRGIFEDKVTKNIFSTEYIWHSIKYEKTVGVIEDNENEENASFVRQEIKSEPYTSSGILFVAGRTYTLTCVCIAVSANTGESGSGTESGVTYKDGNVSVKLVKSSESPKTLSAAPT